MVAGDVLVLIPWLLFAASVGIIVLIVARHRPSRPDPKSARPPDKRPETRAGACETSGEPGGTGPRERAAPATEADRPDGRLRQDRPPDGRRGPGRGPGPGSAPGRPGEGHQSWS